MVVTGERSDLGIPFSDTQSTRELSIPHINFLQWQRRSGESNGPILKPETKASPLTLYFKDFPIALHLHATRYKFVSQQIRGGR
jgi:hypothetical protein